MNFRHLVLISTLGLLTACGTSPTNSPTIHSSESIRLSGTIVENPAHLADQSAFMFIDTTQNRLLAYVDSPTIALSDYLGHLGVLEGTVMSTSVTTVPSIEVSNFTPNQPLTEEDILLDTVKRESKKAPYNFHWDQATHMLVLQRDSSNGSAQIQVEDSRGKYTVSLVKNSNDWHIADIKQLEYSSGENTTGSGETLLPQASP